MKHIIFAYALLWCTIANAEITETATSAVKNMGIGWNLGNTLDANGQLKSTNPDDATYWNCQGLESETYWGQYTTTAGLFNMFKDAGFGAIRVPVTWYNHMDVNGKIDEAWMARVHAVVDYVINSGLYCIINVHHDTGADGSNNVSWIKADEANYNKNKTRYEYLWKQIANEFKDYDEHLLFEGYNEMLDTKSSWCFASFNTTGQYNATIANSAYNGLNSYAQSFVNAVRSTGGNNASRNLIVNTYAAACGTGTWNSHLQDPLKFMNLPKDDVSGHIIFEVHSYPAIANKNSQGNIVNRTIADIKNEVDNLMSTLSKSLASKGAPVIIGEWGTSNVDAGNGMTDYDARRSLMLSFADYFVKKAKENNIGTFYWMGLSNSICRIMPAFDQADLAECISKAYHGSTYNGKFPIPDKISSYVCFEGDKLINWGNGISIPAELFKFSESSITLRLSYKQESSSDDIQFMLGDWSEGISFKVDGKTYKSDFHPISHYSTAVGTEHVTDITFDLTTFNKLTQKGLVIHGIGVRLRKAQILAEGSTGINTILRPQSESHIYNISGQRVQTPCKKGLYIINGKKTLVK